MSTCLVLINGRNVEMLAHPVTDELAITPCPTDAHSSEGYAVTHIPTGYRASPGTAVCLECAKSMADRLANCGVNWSAAVPKSEDAEFWTDRGTHSPSVRLPTEVQAHGGGGVIGRALLVIGISGATATAMGIVSNHHVPIWLLVLTGVTFGAIGLWWDAQHERKKEDQP